MSEENKQEVDNSMSHHHVEILKSMKETELSLSVRLRHMEFPIGRLIALTPGSFLKFRDNLNKPAELIVNKKKIATGKVVQKGKKYGFRADDFCS